MFEDFRMDKGFDEFINPEKIMETRKNSLILEYLEIVNKVIDDHRDKELSKLMFGKGEYNIGEVISVIDKHKDYKVEFEERFRKSVTVKVKEN